jgi:hypothetical protein
MEDDDDDDDDSFFLLNPHDESLYECTLRNTNLVYYWSIIYGMMSVQPQEKFMV